MNLTARGWGVVGLAVTLVGLAPLFERPLLLGGGAGVGAWLLARQWRFARRAARANDALSVAERPDRDPVSVEESVAVSLSATLPTAPDVSVTVQSDPPVATEADRQADRTVTLAPAETSAQESYVLRCPVAGAHDFGATTVEFADRLGLFESTTRRDSPATLTVDPRSPPAVHVGQGGDRAMAFGDYATGELGPGIEPAGVRQYVPGDSAGDIDWKTTARLGDPHVREFEISVDRRATLVVDHRETMADGPPGERKLDYARSTALAYLQAASRNREAVGLVAVGEEGLTERVASGVGDEHYGDVGEVVDGLAPTDAATPPATPGRAPATARAMASTLDGEATPFARTLQPYFADSTAYVRRVADDPLYRAVTAEDASRGAVVHVILSDDRNVTELRETVRAASRDGDPVLVFLTPSVLFDPGGLADLDRAYDRYVAFEELRRELTGYHNVEAFEVGPRDRVEALLARAGEEGRA
jgi:uncharacterized protein (DUF58 family)